MAAPYLLSNWRDVTWKMIITARTDDVTDNPKSDSISRKGSKFCQPLLEKTRWWNCWDSTLLFYCSMNHLLSIGMVLLWVKCSAECTYWAQVSPAVRRTQSFPSHHPALHGRGLELSGPGEEGGKSDENILFIFHYSARNFITARWWWRVIKSD